MTVATVRKHADRFRALEIFINYYIEKDNIPLHISYLKITAMILVIGSRANMLGNTMTIGTTQFTLDTSKVSHSVLLIKVCQELDIRRNFRVLTGNIVD